MRINAPLDWRLLLPCGWIALSLAGCALLARFPWNSDRAMIIAVCGISWYVNCARGSPDVGDWACANSQSSNSNYWQNCLRARLLHLIDHHWRNLVSSDSLGKRITTNMKGPNQAMQQSPVPSGLLSRFLLPQEVAPEASGAC